MPCVANFSWSRIGRVEKKLLAGIGVDKIQLVTISRPSAYGEYEPYRFVDSEQEFEQELMKLK